MTTTMIRHGSLLDVAAHRAQPADLLIDGPIIREIGKPGRAAPPGAVVIDARDRLLIPGLVNAHTHAHGTLARGRLDDRATLEVLLTLGASSNASRTVEDKYLSAQLSAIEMVRKGCTACYDLFAELPAPTPEGVHAVARAYVDVGMRAVVAPMMADLTLYQALPGLLGALPESGRAQAAQMRATPWPASIAACREILSAWPFDRDRVRPALGPTIPMHCNDEFLVACRDLAREFGVGIQTHLAESKTQAVVGRKKYGKTLTAHLGDLGLLGPGFSAAHAIWLDRDDIRRLADAGATVAHNPLSNLRLGSGVARVRTMLEAGVTVGIGTDSAASSDTQNMFEATRLAAYLSHVSTPDYRRWLTSEEAFTMATTGSATVLGMQERIGRLAPGYQADIVFLDLTSIGYVPLNDVLLQLVNGESGTAVASVMIGGRLVLDAGRLLTVDEAKVRRDAETAIARLTEANAASLAFARTLEASVGGFSIARCSEMYGVERLLPPETS
jgi:cytosine/adenosine deaminase-related metal-dependent hydrolase